MTGTATFDIMITDRHLIINITIMYLKRKHFSEVLKTAGLKEKRLFNNSNRIGGSGNAMIFIAEK